MTTKTTLTTLRLPKRFADTINDFAERLGYFDIEGVNKHDALVAFAADLLYTQAAREHFHDLLPKRSEIDVPRSSVNVRGFGWLTKYRSWPLFQHMLAGERVKKAEEDAKRKRQFEEAKRATRAEMIRERHTLNDALREYKALPQAAREELEAKTPTLRRIMAEA